MEEVRCSVDYWAEFGDLLSGRVLLSGSEVLLTTGSRDVLVLDCQNKTGKASVLMILIFKTLKKF